MNPRTINTANEYLALVREEAKKAHRNGYNERAVSAAALRHGWDSREFCDTVLSQLSEWRADEYYDSIDRD